MAMPTNSWSSVQINKLIEVSQIEKHIIGLYEVGMKPNSLYLRLSNFSATSLSMLDIL